MQGFLFLIQEHEGTLSLFLKSESRTICVKVLDAEYELKFLPVESHFPELIAEIEATAAASGGQLKRFETRSLRYSFENQSVPIQADWLCASFTSECKISTFPKASPNYRFVFGLKSSLAEQFTLKHSVKGPQWVSISGTEPIDLSASIPVFGLSNSESVSVVDGPTPLFNVCCFATQKTRSNELLFISMRIASNCSIDSLEGQKQLFTLTTVESAPDALVCQSEPEMVQRFFGIIAEFGVDLLLSFDLRSDLERLCQFAGSETPFAGRIYCDVRISCLEFLKGASNVFADIVKSALGIERQQIETIDIRAQLSEIGQVANLVQYNQRDAFFVEGLVVKMKLLPLSLQLAQLSGTAWGRVLAGGAARRCESLFLHSFTALGFVIPEKRELPPGSRDTQYMGGLVLEPLRGFYRNCVILLDFSSLYPSIIREYNLCFTTVPFDSNMTDADRIALAERIKSEQIGILPQIMTDLVGARVRVEARLAQATDRAEIASLGINKSALKLLANAMYGYLGFPGSRFPAIHLAEMVTCLGRHALERTVAVIETRNFKVLYGDTDSVMVDSQTRNREEAKATADRLAAEVSSEYRLIRMRTETIFSALLLANKKRYAYLDEDGEIQVKGLDIVRRDFCELVKYASRFLLGRFFRSGDTAAAFQEVVAEIARLSDMMRNSGLPTSLVPPGLKEQIVPEDLIVYKSLTKGLSGFERRSVHVSVAQWMAENGYTVNPNDTIPYIMINNKAVDYADKAKHPSQVVSVADCDVQWYLTNQLLPPLMRLFENFGDFDNQVIRSSIGYDKPSPKAGQVKEELLTCDCPTCKRMLVIEQGEPYCRACKTIVNWKYACNMLTKKLDGYFRKWSAPVLVCDACQFRSTQIPLSRPYHMAGGRMCRRPLRLEIAHIDIHRHLQRFLSQFENVKRTPFTTYMESYLSEFLALDGFHRVRITSILSVPPWE
jgi:DNA polymerase alpha subunit A